jgi:hypothetical protein
LGELSKPATVLVEKISEAVGGVFKPYQIRRIARAEADAERIRANAEIEVSDLQRRAVQRWLAEEVKKQDNIEAITSKALPDLDEVAEPERIEGDWITNFFDKARLISDDQMQALWAKVLAGEANHPGTYSKRTVNFLASLSALDARLFTKLTRFCWYVGYVQPLVFRVGDQIYAEAGIEVGVLTHLDDIGLIRYDSSRAFHTPALDGPRRTTYFDEVVMVDLRFPGGSMPIGCVLLSKVGVELAPLCHSQPITGFPEYVFGKWLETGLTVSSPYPRVVTAR